MTGIIIAASAVLVLAAIAVFLLYYFGFVGFYHPMKKAGENQIRIACVGDSITFGCTVGNRKRNNYPAVLGALLGGGYCVNNFGYTDRTAIKSADRPYVKEKLYRQSLEFKPDIVFIMLGANDTKEKNWNREKFINDYCEIVCSYRELESSPTVYILSLTPMFEVRGKIMWQLRSDTAKREAAPAIKLIAEKTGAEYIDMYSALEGRKDLFSDGVHPNAEGSKLIAGKIYGVIKGERGNQAPPEMKTESVT